MPVTITGVVAGDIRFPPRRTSTALTRNSIEVYPGSLGEFEFPMGNAPAAEGMIP